MAATIEVAGLVGKTGAVTVVVKRQPFFQKPHQITLPDFVHDIYIVIAHGLVYSEAVYWKLFHFLANHFQQATGNLCADPLA